MAAVRHYIESFNKGDAKAQTALQKVGRWMAEQA